MQTPEAVKPKAGAHRVCPANRLASSADRGIEVKALKLTHPDRPAFGSLAGCEKTAGGPGWRGSAVRRPVGIKPAKGKPHERCRVKETGKADSSNTAQG